MLGIIEGVNDLKIIFKPDDNEDQLSAKDTEDISFFLNENDYDNIEIILDAPIDSLKNIITNIYSLIRFCEIEKNSVIRYKYKEQECYTTFLNDPMSEIHSITIGYPEARGEIETCSVPLPHYPTSSSLVEDKPAPSLSDPIYWSDDSNVQPKPSDLPSVKLVKKFTESNHNFRYTAKENSPIIEDSLSHAKRFVIQLIGDASCIQFLIKKINTINPNNEIELMLFFPLRKSNSLAWIGMFCKKQQINNKIILNIIFDTSIKYKKNFEYSITDIEEMIKFLPNNAMVILDSALRDTYQLWFLRLSEIFGFRKSLQSTPDSLALITAYLNPANKRCLVSTGAAKSSSAFFKSRSELCETAKARDLPNVAEQATGYRARASISTSTFARATSSMTPEGTSPNEALGLLELPPFRTLIETPASGLPATTATMSTRRFDQPTLHATSSNYGLDERTEGSRRDKRMEPTLSASTDDAPDTSSRSAHLRARQS